MSVMREDDDDTSAEGATQPPTADDGTEPVVELRPETATEPPGRPTEAALEELKTEVLSAVRGAITGVMSRHQPAMPQPDLDLDFSLRETEPPILAPLEAPDAVAGFNSTAVMAGIAPLDAAAPMLPVAMSLAHAPFEQRLTVTRLPPTPLPPPSRPWPAWTAAAMLSIAGVTVGAGAAILLIDPHVVASFKDRVDRNLEMVLAVPGSDNASYGRPDTEVTTTANDRIAGASADPLDGTSLLVLSDPIVAAGAKATISAAGRPLSARDLIDVADAGARVIPRSSGNSRMLAAAEPRSAELDLAKLARSVRIATVAEAAAFAHSVVRPAKAGVLAATGGQPVGLEALAALPPPAAVAAPVETGAEPAAAAVAIIAAPHPALSASGQSGAVPEVEQTMPAAPLSPMARANAALQNGDVETARMLLLSESEAGQVEAMLALARSYDPSYLKLIGVPSAKGNAGAAEKLYRSWYERSVTLGLISEGINLDRLIRAMARAKP